MTNSGTVDLVVSSVIASTGAFRVVSVSVPFTLRAGLRTGVQVAFAPTAAGAASGMVSVVSNDSAHSPLAISLTGNGVAQQAPQITVSPSTLDFGSVAVGQFADLSITIGNTGGGNLNVTSYTSSNPVFNVSAPPLVVFPGLAAKTSVRFTPASAGAVSGTLTIASNDAAKPSFTISLTGTGTTQTCSYVLNPNSISVPAVGGSGTVGVAASNPFCALTATSSAIWLHVGSIGSTSVAYSVDANTIATARTGTISIGGSTFTVNQAAGTQTAAGPVAWWQLKEGSGTSVADSVNGNSGLLSGTVSWGAAPVNGALTFDGNGSKVTGSNSGKGFPVGSSPRTIATWIKVTNPPTTDNGILHYGTASGTAPGSNFHLYLRGADGKIGLGNGYGFGTIAGTKTLSDGKWHHVAGVYEGSGTNVARIYVDGALDSSGTLTSIPNTLNGSNWSMGAFMGGGTTFRGSIGDLRLYDRALSVAEISSLAIVGATGNLAISFSPNPVPKGSDGKWTVAVTVKETGGVGVTVTKLTIAGTDYTSSIATYLGSARIAANGSGTSDIFFTGATPPFDVVWVITGNDDAGHTGLTWTGTVRLNP